MTGVQTCALPIWPPFPLVLPACAFVAQPEFDHHPTRGGVSGEVPGQDATEAQLAEAIREDGPGGLGAVSASPERPSGPVADLGAGIVPVDHEPHGPNQLPAIPERPSSAAPSGPDHRDHDIDLHLVAEEHAAPLHDRFQVTPKSKRLIVV